jgi:hypothetical protein
MKKLTTNADIVGKRFGKLVGLHQVEDSKYGQKMWECKCDCGVLKKVSGLNLIYGKTKSCGCTSHIGHRKTHGLSNHILHRTWSHMKERCFNKNSNGYRFYGAKGIGMCDEWRYDFKAFYDWSIENGWNDKLTIDRFPNKTGDYSPDNCRWTDMGTQNRNRVDNVYLECRGMKMTVAEFARLVGINRTAIDKRIRRGWTIENAIYTPSNRNNIL